MLNNFTQCLLVIAILQSTFQAINQRHIRKAGAGFEDKIAEETLIQRHRGRLAEQLAEGRQVALAANHAENIVLTQPRAAGRVKQGVIPEQGGNARFSGHMQIAQGRAHAPLIGA